MRRMQSLRSDLLKLLRPGGAASLGFRLGFGKESKSRLAPGKADPDINERVGSTAGAGKQQDVINRVGLAGHKRHRHARHMVRGRIHTQDKITGTNVITHGGSLSCLTALAHKVIAGRKISQRNALKASAPAPDNWSPARHKVSEVLLTWLHRQGGRPADHAPG